MTSRLKGWEKRYITLVEDVLAQPFSWEHSNCAHLVAAAIRACHGEHPVLEHLKACTSQEAAMAHLQENGGLSGILGQYFQMLPTPLIAQQADVGIFEGKMPDGSIIGVGCIILDGVAVGKQDDANGAFRMSVRSLKRVFKI